MRIARISMVAAMFVAGMPAASAVKAPHGPIRPELEIASGAPVRVQRVVDYDRAPSRTIAAWHDFLQHVGPSWRASFDRHTQVPARIFGEGIPVPGSVANAAVAEAYARQMLVQRIELLAPGARASDFVVVANELWRGMRTVAFRQYANGLEVLGGQVNFRFKNDRMFVIGSEAMPDVSVARPSRTVNAQTARANALAWIEADFAPTDAEVELPGAPVVLPLIRDNGVSYEVVVGVVVRTTQPIGKWMVYVDAKTGAPVARTQLLRFATGTIYYNAPVRRPGSTRMDFAARYARVNVNGTNITADGAGVLTWPSGTGNGTFDVGGAYVNVLHDQGAEVTGAFSLTDGGTATWDRSTNEFEDAQLTSFIHANIVKDWARPLAPYMTWIDGQIQVTVNINDVCNAFSDGDSINFFEAGSVSGLTCDNTGRLADVVHHEFGHSFHAHAIIDGAGAFDGALSEGLSDFVAATISDDSGMGRGFFGDDAPLREIGSPDRVWPDDIHPDIHETGIIYAGAFWDLRANLVEIHGLAGAIAIVDPLFADSVRTTPDIPSSYIEVLTHDDDNGNLMDGTPNQCAINDAFMRHGLAAPGVEGGPGVQRPRLDPDLKVVVPVVTSVECPGAAVTSAEVVWQLRDAPAGGTIPMTPNAEGYEAQIPPQPVGQVLEYQVNVTLENGQEIVYPDNPADRFYQHFIGEVTEIYCTDFETDPASDGWTHALTAGMMQEGADDWQWGQPQGTPGSGDPSEAYSGANVYGNDLGGGNYNGMYQPDKVNHLLSPAVDVSGATNVRLQFRRWLNVEDATYDRATIFANDEVAWVNLETPSGSTNHTDKEWRFQDVDLTPFVQDGMVAVKFQIASDQGLEMGGWTIDDFCIVSFATGPQECGNGTLELPEECDDGNTTDGDGCESDCTLGGGPGDPDAGGTVDFPDAGTNAADSEGGCGCRAGSTGAAPAGAALLVLGALALVIRRRRR